MALGADKRMIVSGGPNRGMQAGGPWVQVLDAGGISTLDANPIINPTTQIVNSTTHKIIRNPRDPSKLRIRMLYPVNLATITDAVIRVFGRAVSTDSWEALSDGSASDGTTLTTDTTNDVRNSTGTGKHTVPVEFDVKGSTEILIGVETALSAVTGDESLATVQAKLTD